MTVQTQLHAYSASEIGESSQDICEPISQEQEKPDETLEDEVTNKDEAADEESSDETPEEFDPDSLYADDEDYQRPDVLRHYHNEHGYAAERIARDIFDDEITGETIRHWLEKHSLKSPPGSILSLSGHTGAEPLALLGEIARKNGESMIDTGLEELIEKYGDKISREAALE